MEILFAIFSGMAGAVFGSFAVAQVWRIRAFQLLEEKNRGEKIDKAEFSKLKNLTESKKNRSHCLNCDYQLRWFDLIPIFSWLFLRGKCRKCRKKIGWLEFVAEISMAAIFVAILLSFASIFGEKIPLRIFVLFAAMVPLAILFIYDAKWSLLPTKIMWTFNFLAATYFALSVFEVGFSPEILANLLFSIMIFPAVYFVLATISKGAWVGDGDWILALGLILLLPNSPFFAALLLLFSNFIGIFTIFAGGILQKTKIRRGAQIPFGPAMIAACLILLIFQPFFEKIMYFLA